MVEALTTYKKQHSIFLSTQYDIGSCAEPEIQILKKERSQTGSDGQEDGDDSAASPARGELKIKPGSVSGNHGRACFSKRLSFFYKGVQIPRGNI